MRYAAPQARLRASPRPPRPRPAGGPALHANAIRCDDGARSFLAMIRAHEHRLRPRRAQHIHCPAEFFDGRRAAGRERKVNEPDAAPLRDLPIALDLVAGFADATVIEVEYGLDPEGV